MSTRKGKSKTDGKSNKLFKKTKNNPQLFV